MATESNITHRVASLPLYRLPAEASFAVDGALVTEPWLLRDADELWSSR